jgi:hypothetical protein
MTLHGQQSDQFGLEDWQQVDEKQLMYAKTVFKRKMLQRVFAAWQQAIWLKSSLLRHASGLAALALLQRSLHTWRVTAQKVKRLRQLLLLRSFRRWHARSRHSTALNTAKAHASAALLKWIWNAWGLQWQLSCKAAAHRLKCNCRWRTARHVLAVWARKCQDIDRLRQHDTKADLFARLRLLAVSLDAWHAHVRAACMCNSRVRLVAV